jgi:hypothetical protein
MNLLGSMCCLFAGRCDGEAARPVKAPLSRADLGQKEAGVEKKEADLERLSEEQLRHMEGGRAAKSVAQQKAKEESN